MERFFDSPEWWRATTLAERLATLRRRGPASGIDRARAERELAHWRAQPPFEIEGLFERRLEQEGLSPAELTQLLGESIEELHARSSERPAWLETLARAYARDPRPLASLWPAELARVGDANLVLLDAFEPLVTHAVEELARECAALEARHGRVPFDARSAPTLFLPALLGALERLALSSFALELGIARMNGELAGATPAERFQSFARRLRGRAAALEFLRSYPVLARRVIAEIERWRTTSGEFLTRLAQDADALARRFARDAGLGQLASVRPGAGDTHRGGRSVVLATFDSELRLVYKPRSLTVEARFQGLVEELNAAGQEPVLATIALLDRGTHGWVEFVEPRPCATLDGVRAFYRRQGAWLALLHALGATDAHYENLVAAGEHPVPIDLETLFHARAHERELQDRGQHLVREALQRSVLRVGLLPNRVAGADGEAVDLGGLSASEGQRTPDELLVWEGAGTDELRAVRRRAELRAASNLPSLDGSARTADAYVAEIVSGFRSTWSRLRTLRARWLAPGGALARFAEDEVRTVVRATRFYGLLLQESVHADFQGDALELERLFDRLWIGVAELPHLERVLASERRDLLAGDVPCFVSKPGARDLWDSAGRRIEGFWRSSGLEFVAATLGREEVRELERQEWLIRGALATAGVSERDPRWPSYVARVPERAPPESELRARALEQARAVGERLEALALRDGAGHAAWMGFVFVGTRWELAALPDDLYAGVPGVALFLAQLARVTGEERFTVLARAALADLRAQPARVERLASIGAFNGLGGVLYAFAHLAHFWQDAELLARAGELASLAAERLAHDEDLDVIGGAAGLLAALESLHALDPRARGEELMRACGARLCARAEPQHEGVGWRTRIGGPEPGSGFSHGAAGITWALLRLHARLGASAVLEHAREGIRFEDSLFEPSTGNWLDPGSRRVGLEAGASDGTTLTAWCYGAPGIGLARLAALAPSNHELAGEARRDVQRSIEATLARGFGRNHCLCHGALGNLDFLRRAAATLADDGLAADARRHALAVLASLERDGFLCGMPMGIESPSLMNGLAGIGHGLLRLARPEDVPSVLTLDVPRG